MCHCVLGALCSSPVGKCRDQRPGHVFERQKVEHLLSPSDDTHEGVFIISLHMCACVCIYACMCMCVCACVLCVYLCVCMCMCVCACVLCVYLCVCLCVYICVCVCKCVYMCVCVCVCVHVCVRPPHLIKVEVLSLFPLCNVAAASNVAWLTLAKRRNNQYNTSNATLTSSSTPLCLCVCVHAQCTQAWV